MLIKLNVIPNGCSTHLYVLAERGEQGCSVDNGIFYQLRIMHNPRTCAIDFFPELPVNCDNDYYLTFRSKVSFSSFCSRFMASEYNDPKNYNLIFHNCANAAHFVLTIAEIDFPSISNLRLMSLSPQILTRIPGPALIPVDLFRTAVKHKIKQLEYATAPFSKTSFKVALASTTLNFWARNEANIKKKESARTVVSEINFLVQKRPHHTELYLQNLLDTIEILMGVKTQKEAEEYLAGSRLFQERRVTEEVIALNIHMNCCFLVSLISLYPNFIMSDTSEYKNYLLTALFFLLAFTTTFYVLAAQENKKNVGEKRMETRLFRAVKDMGTSYIQGIKSRDLVEAPQRNAGLCSLT